MKMQYKKYFKLWLLARIIFSCI